METTTKKSNRVDVLLNFRGYHQCMLAPIGVGTLPVEM
jgi:hypothetical protein